MKQRTLAAILTIASILIILDVLNAGHALTMLLLAGIVPGTNVIISADRMFEIILMLSGFTIARIIVAAFHAYERAHSSNGTMLSAQS